MNAAIDGFTVKAIDALRDRLVLMKGRTDIEVLAIRGVRAAWVQDWATAEPGLEFTVEFTFTSGPRRRRRADVGFHLLPPTTHDSDIVMPEALHHFLTLAVMVETAGDETHYALRMHRKRLEDGIAGDLT